MGATLCRVGTSGFSYPAWRGRFYPEDLASDAMLAYYATRLEAVEVNNTFYRMPSPAMLESWCAKVPDSFRFVVKAPRRLSHDQPSAELESGLARLYTATAVLGQRLALVYFQLARWARKDLVRLERVLAATPAGTRLSFELRHPSWRDDDVLALLRAHNAALCVSDRDDAEPEPMIATADFGHLRLRRWVYGDDDLDTWLRNIQAQPWREAFVFFKHEDEARGPELALELARRLPAPLARGEAPQPHR